MRPFRFEQRLAEVVTRALFPAGSLGGTVDRIRVGEAFADDCANSPWYAGALIRGSLLLVWTSPVWRRRQLRLFDRLEEWEQSELLDELMVHPQYPLRMASLMLKLTLSSLVVGDPDALANIGAYDTTQIMPPIVRVKAATEKAS